MLEISNCPICDSTNFSEERKVRDYSVSKEFFPVQNCASCGHRFTSPLPGPEAIGPYYDSPDYISHTDDGSSVFGKVYKSLRSVNMAKKHSHVKRWVAAGRHLDYGCGTGTFLEYMLSKGYSSEGVELNAGARSKASAYGNVAANILETKGTFNAITLWHVLEHIYNLKELMLEFQARLKDDGALFIAVPNPESPDAKHYKEHWAAWDIPIHAQHFSKSSMRTLAANTGFEVKEILPMKLDAFYIALLSEQYKANKSSKTLLHWIKALFIGLKSNLSAGKDNTSSLIYVLQKV